jgi:hypothetical protein
MSDQAKQSDHETRPIPMKMIDVDIGIVPVVNWLNSMQGVYTEYSCQGDPDNAALPVGIPYVRFFCTDMECIREIEGVLIKAARNIPDREHLSISENKNYYNNGRTTGTWDIHASGQATLAHLMAAILSRQATQDTNVPHDA